MSRGRTVFEFDMLRRIRSGYHFNGIVACVAGFRQRTHRTSGIRVDCDLCPPAIGIGATAALSGSMMANAENSAVASVRSSSSASESPSARILRICSSLIV